jgi:AcrR family transcriptional regulator
MPTPNSDPSSDGGAHPSAQKVGGSARLALRSDAREVEEQIMTATEALLGEDPLADLSVSAICRRAGIARGTFYFYFGSKYAVVAALLARVMDEIYESMTAFAGEEGRPQEDGAVSPAAALEAGLRGGWTVWTRHRLLFRVVSEQWAQVPELREMRLLVMDRFTDAISHEIDRERSAGLAPPGIESRRLAALLLWAAERHAYVAGLGLDPELPSEEEIFDSVLQFWLRAIYGQPVRGSE